jgi:hypothetical protein
VEGSIATQSPIRFLINKADVVRETRPFLAICPEPVFGVPSAAVIPSRVGIRHLGYGAVFDNYIQYKPPPGSCSKTLVTNPVPLLMVSESNRWSHCSFTQR